MENEFVPYGIALQMKELGYNERNIYHYANGVLQEGITYNSDHRDYESISAPLYQQAFRFFREEYELFVDWNHGQHDNFGSYFGFCIENIHLEGTIVGVYKTYEEAELECLKKLIELCKKH